MAKVLKRDLFKSRLSWSNTAIVSFVAGVISILGFFALALATKPPEGIEAQISEPRTYALFGIVGVGIVAGLIFAISLFALLFKKSRIGAVIIALLALAVPASLGILIFSQTNLKNTNTPQSQTNYTRPDFTGQQLFDAVNVYRKANGVEEVKLDQNLCNNLAQRYFDIKKGIDEGVAHAKLDEWIKKYVPSNYYVSEDFAWGKTPEEVIKEWEGSPGHRLSILDPRNKLGCSYAADGYGVIELGYRVVSNVEISTYTGDGTRTGKIVPYHEWCENKDIRVYENELVTRKSSDGKIYTMTQGDWDCYENFLKNG